MADFTAVDELVKKGIEEGAFPGAAYAIGHNGKIYLNAAGRYMYCPDSPPTRIDTIWDLASVSKVVGCTSAAMILFDEGKLKLDQPVVEIIPEFGQNGKEKITPRNLLLHNAGFPAGLPRITTYRSAESFMQAVYAMKLKYETGTDTIYSDLSFIVLGKVIERLTDKPLDVFVKERVLSPLGMKDSCYCPGPELRQRCAPTEAVQPWREELRHIRHQVFTPVHGCHPDAHLYIQGEVHDPSADVLNGVSGNAGLFSTAPDLCIFMQMMLDGGRFKGQQIIRSETIHTWTRRQNSSSSRGFGWDTPSEHSSAGHKLSPHSFGHTGYTGTSVWGDPEHGLYVILLTNRVFPTAANHKQIKFRPVFHDAVATACGIG